MSKQKIIRAWKDDAYRQSLSAAERAMIPGHPAGEIEVPEEQLAGVAGGYNTFQYSICVCYTVFIVCYSRFCLTPTCPM